MTNYTELIPAANRSKDKFYQTIQITTDPFAINPISISDFDLDSATGKQLDILGEWIGANRNIDTPITGVYFAFDASGIGFDEGVWKGKYDPSYGITSLDDEIFRLILRAQIKANHWNGTLETLPEIYKEIFKDSGVKVFPVDNQDMTMSIYIIGQPNELLKQIILRGYLNVKPSTVGTVGYFTPSQDTQFFGFDIQNNYIQGFDVGSWAVNFTENK